MSGARRAPKPPSKIRPPRAEAVIAATAVTMFGAMALLAVQYVGIHSDLETANQARDALASQVEKLGGTPVAGSPGSRGSIGPAGAEGPRGPRGYPGSPGPTGSPGVSGSPGATGSPGAAGASGSPGVNGADGVAGSPGPTGVQGEPGPAGSDGKDGTAGQPPYSWTYTDPSGVGYDCERAAGFDPDSPRYDCTATSTPTPSPSNGLRKGLLGAAALASAASYRKL